MSTIVTIQSTDIIANSRADINTNFANLNTDLANKTDGVASSVDNEVALFSGTGGKTLKRASSTGWAKLLAGVLSIVTSIVETDFGFTDVTTADVTSTKHGLTPKAPADATKFLNGAATPAFAQVKDSDLATTDVTTNNATSLKHGFLPKLSGSSGDVLKGDGTFGAAPSSTSGQSTSGSNTATQNVDSTLISLSSNSPLVANDVFVLAFSITSSVSNASSQTYSIKQGSNVLDTLAGGTNTNATATYFAMFRVVDSSHIQPIFKRTSINGSAAETIGLSQVAGPVLTSTFTLDLVVNEPFGSTPTYTINAFHYAKL